MSNARTTQKTMRACALEAYGGSERMRLMELSVPETRDVLIPMYSAEVSEWEALVRDGAAAPFPSVTHMQQRERERSRW
jgi:NADPH:quinone reductase-like Zn-dependent oxidoreductase